VALNKNIKFNGPVLVFTAIAAWYLITNFIWWSINTPVVPWYDASAAHFLDIFKTGFLFYNAPVITWIFKFLFLIFDRKYADIIIISFNYVCFLTALYFIYKIGEEIESRETGQIAMILFAMVPAVYWLSRHYGRQDYHVMSVTAVSIYCLIKSDNFQNRKWSLALGACVGIGFLIKDAFLIYISGPFCYAVFAGLKKKDKYVLMNILLSSGIAAALAGIHYFRYDIIKKIYMEPTRDPVSLASFDTIKNVTIGLSDSLLSFPVFIVFLAGLWYFISRYKNKNKTIILLWITVSWCLITFMPQKKDPDYFAGMIPAMILAAAVFLAQIKPLILKKTILFFLIITGAFQYINFSFYPQKWLTTINIKVSGKKFNYYNTNYVKMNFDVKQQVYKIIKTIDYINEQCPNSKICLYVNEKSKLQAKVLRTGMLLKNMKVAPRDTEIFVLEKDDDAVVIVGELMPETERPLQMSQINEKFGLASTIFYLKSKQDVDNRIRIFKKKIL